MLEISRAQIDESVLDSWIASLGLLAPWQRAQAMVGQD